VDGQAMESTRFFLLSDPLTTINLTLDFLHLVQ
jgi:hypothetical protein